MTRHRAELGEAGKFNAVISENIGAVGKPVGRICLGSFGNGYTTTREILRNPDLAEHVNDGVLAVRCMRAEEWTIRR